MSKLFNHIVAFATLICLSSATFTLEPYSTLYIPSMYDSSGNPMYEYGGDAIEDSAYDDKDDLVYTAGDAFINVIDVRSVNSPEILHKQMVTSDTPVVTICGSFVTFLSDNTAPWMDGTLSIYNKYDRSNPGVLTKVRDIPVGPEPESIAFTSDCRIAVVANSATPEVDQLGTDIMDPEGSVSIIEFEGGDLSKEPKSNMKVNFVAFDSRKDEYVSRGVRFVYQGQISTRNTPTLFSQDLQPEYVVLNNQGTKAYVCLQNNNAIAVIDIASRTVDDIYPLGTKSWDMLDIDVSSMDGGIKFTKWPIKTLYQPDEIRYFESGGAGYVVTANEGHPVDVELESLQRTWTDAKLGGEFTDAELSPKLDARLRNALTNNATLKFYEFSTIDGLDADGKIQELHGFGGRGISVYRVSDFQQVYESGDSVSKMHARDYPAVFNADDEPATQSPQQLMDLRSTQQGVDCESLEIGMMDGKRLIFVGADRIGTLMIFSLDTNSAMPTLESVYRNGSTDRPISNLFNDRMLNDAAPEALTFIPANSGAGSFPMLMVAGTESGTLSFYRVKNDGSGAEGTGAMVQMTLVSVLVVVVQVIT